MKSGMNFTVHGICIDQSVLVVKSGEHYDAIVPNNINLSTIAVNHNRDITLSCSGRLLLIAPLSDAV